MPQNRRKTPFSGKKKKDQILQKRQFKAAKHYFKGTSDSHEDGETTEDTEQVVARKLMEQPLNRGGGGAGTSGGGGRNINRYNLQFFQESKKELEQMRQEGYQPLQLATAKEREIDAHYFDNFDFPVRPQWSWDMSKETLERNENRYFREYVEQLQKKHHNDNKELSLFELNLETWRQLWRVLEFSDILLIIVDVRYATLMFPPALYKHIVETLKKHAILVLNKVDLVAADVVVAWRQYFRDNYPGLPIVLFASYPAKALKGTSRGRQGHKRSMEGVQNIFRECQRIVTNAGAAVDLTSWEQKILEDMRADSICCEEEDAENAEEGANAAAKPTATNDHDAVHPCAQPPHIAYRDGILTVGCIGFPNVGKSSLINALKGRKVVSVSRTPGHTKHFQTIFLTHTVRLCDCPGLVFPSSTPKYIQVLLGSFPISQLQVPFRPLKFLAEHINLPQLLKLHLPEDFDEWSAVAIADAWALKRGFLTAKAARPDRSRAANYLLRMCLAGQQQLVLQFYPPGYERDKEKWLQHAEVAEVNKYQQAQNDVESKDVEQGKEQDDASSVNSESVDSEESRSSNDESDADDEGTTEQQDQEDAAAAAAVVASKTRTHNTFALLEDVLED